MGIRKHNQVLGAGESFSIKKGYGLLVVSNLSSGYTAAYIVNNGSCTFLSGNETGVNVTLSRVGEFEISIKNNHTTNRTFDAVFVG